jgi:SAM-dependent methyltransferase
LFSRRNISHNDYLESGLTEKCMKYCLACSQSFTSKEWVCPHCNWKPSRCNDYIFFAPEFMDVGEGFDVDYFAQLAGIEGKNFWFKSRNKIIIWLLHRFFSCAESIFEIGCGTGFVLSGINKEFPSTRLFGSDIFIQGLDFAKRRVPKAIFYQMDARKIPFEDEFDIVGAFDILEHIEEDELVLFRIFKSLKRKGGIILTLPQYKWLWSPQDEQAHHKRRYTRIELINKMEGAGFKVIFITSYISLMFPLMVIDRFFARFIAFSTTRNHDAIKAISINPLMNRILELICNLEIFFLKKGLTFPMGGSLICIGVKA